MAFRDRDGWLEPHERIDVLRRLAGLIDGRGSISPLIAQEGGKPLSDARVEVTRAIDGVRDAADELRNFGGKEIPMGLTAASAGRLAFTIREPIGVVAAISAFNHPLNLIVHQVVPAIAAGCPVIVKPACATPLSCFGFVDLVREAGLPEPWCQTFLPESNERAEALATDPRIAFLSFIGSARVGWYLHGKLAPGTRSALEHGGVAPVIVDAAPISTVSYRAGEGRLLPRRAGLRVDAAHLRPCLREGPLPRAVHRGGGGAAGRRSAAAGDRGRPADPAEGGGPGDVLDRGGQAAGAGVAVGGERLSETTVAPTVLLDPPRTPASRKRRCSAR